MRNWRTRIANWTAPLVCPGCEEGSGLILDCSTGRFERCSICQGGASVDGGSSNDAMSRLINATVVQRRDRDEPRP